MREKIAECVANIFLSEMTITDFENVADKVLSLHREMMEIMDKWYSALMFYSPEANALIFNGHRITKPIPTSGEDRK